ncbi:MAG: alpha/beta fold hydrolase [Candidatus Thorarchaeota archaeon]|jgi:pimeloyl-ACP methyl ester carboxylesterase
MTDENSGSYIDANGLKMFYKEYGEGHPLILLHGGSINADSQWQQIIPKFSEHFRVITVDSRGHGRTNNPLGEFSYSLMCDDVAAFAKALDLERPFICGWSDGAQIALEIGIQYPNLAKGLVAGGVVIEISDAYVKGMQEMGIKKPGEVDLQLLEEKYPAFVKLWSEIHSPVHGPTYWKKLITSLSDMWLNPKEFPGKRIQEITVPTLILQGDRDDLVPMEDALTAYRLIPKGELSIIPFANHIDIFDRGELATAAIIDYLQRNLD